MRRRRYEDAESQCPSAWLWLVTGILIGIFISFLFYLKAMAPRQVEQPESFEQGVAEETLRLPEPEATQPEKTVQAPPRFEFYDMLPKSEVTPPPSRPNAETELAQAQLPEAEVPMTSAVIPMRPEDFPAAGFAPLPTTAPPAATGQFMLQLASFRDQHSARELQQRLQQQGVSSSIQQALVKGTHWYRVRVGPYETKAQAAQGQRQMRQHGFQAIVVKF